jgi:uroporphyrinogen-III synthase
MSAADMAARAAPLVLVTRPPDAADRLVALLQARGYRVAAVPTVETRPSPPGGPLDHAIADPDGWDWIVVTSATGARAAGEALTRTGTAGGGRGGTARTTRWAAVGPATAGALQALGIPVDLVPRESTGAGIASDLVAPGTARYARILLARADAAAGDLPAALRAAGADVHEVVAYHTVEAPPESAAPLDAALVDGTLAAIVVASGSAVRGLVRLATAAGLLHRVLATPLIAIGPSTSAAARDLRIAGVVQAVAPTPEALVAAVDASVLAPPVAPAPSRRP